MRPYCIVLIFTLFLAFAAPAQAQGVDPKPGTGPGTGCDPEYWNSLSSRAWMEGQHDMEAAQTIMAKPRSVLDVSCFNGKLLHLQDAADDLFSDRTERALGITTPEAISNPLFGCLYCPDAGIEDSVCNDTFDDYEPEVGSACGADPPGGDFSPVKLDNLLTAAIRMGMQTYMNQGFSPNTLCSSMDAVWQEAKCRTFDAGTFITFEQSMWTVPQARTPIVYGCTFGADPSTFLPRLGWWLSYEGGNLPSSLGGAFVPGAYPDPAIPPDGGGMHAVQSFLGMLTSTAPHNTGGCSALTPIPTGVIMVDLDGQEHTDAVCPAPGCSYTGTACAP